MAQKIYTSARNDPRYLLQKSVRIIAKTLKQLSEATERPEIKSKDGGLVQAGGLNEKETASLIGLTRALHALARQADADDVSRHRQLKGMTDEQLAEMERKLKSAEHSEKIKEGLREARLAREVPMEEDEDGREDPEE